MSPEQTYAILFHDLVYTPGAHAAHNEEASVVLRLDQFKAQIDATTPAARPVNWDLASSIIQDTATHEPQSDPSFEVMQLDLSSLAGSPQSFAVATEQVWLENRHLIATAGSARDMFDVLRLSFLSKLREQGPVLEKGFANREPQFRANLAALSAQIAPPPS